MKRHSKHIKVELMEPRLMLSAAAQHVLILSVDGLHQADVTDPALHQNLGTINALRQSGVTYKNARTTSPSDSFPGTLSYLAGAGPGTTGVFYDDSYSRTLFAPGSNPATATPGTEVTYFEALDKNPNLISGGGNFDASSIDPSLLPVDSKGNKVYPNQFLKVNTIFDVAHQAGLYTAFSDKHPAYQIANGPTGKTINDFYSPEINSTTALLDPTTGKTVDANALLASNPFTDVSKYTLVDASTDPAGASDPNLINDTTHNVLLTERYDDLKVQAILNEIAGQASHPSADITNSLVPALFGMNFQAVSVAQKFYQGGVTLLPNGQEGGPSAILQAAIGHTDASIGKIVSALKAANLWSTTELFVTAKHGQAPRVGSAGLMSDSTLPDLLSNAGTPVTFAVQDDVSLLYLADQTQTATALKTLSDFKSTGTIDVYFKGVKQTLPASQIIDKILSGKDLITHGYGDPTRNGTTPDFIVTLKPGYVWVGGNPATKFKFKNAEHGGFSADDTHVPLIVSGGAVSGKVQGRQVSQSVELKQIAVTTLQSLGLDARKLQGAAIEGTQGLPGLLPPSNDHGDNDGQNNNHAHEGFDGDHQQPAQSHHRKNIFADDASIF